MARRAQLLDVHLDRGFAGDVDHQRAGIAQLRADRSGQAIAHRPQSTRSQPFVRAEEREILGRPHLVLADLGGDDRITVAGQGIQPLDRILRRDFGLQPGISETVLAAPFSDASFPGRQILRFALTPRGDQLFQHAGAIADDRHVYGHDLVDRGAVDIDVDLDRIRRKRIQPPGHPIIETRADADHDIGLVHRQIGFVGAVHAQHSQPVGMICRKTAQSHQRRGDGRAGQRLELAQQATRARPGVDDAAAGVENRRLCRCDQGNRPGNVVSRAIDLRIIANGPLRRAVGHDRAGDLNVLGNIDQHRAGATGGGNLESLIDGRGEVCRILHQIIMLGAVAGDTDGVGLLKGVRSDQRGCDLPGDDDHRNRIHISIGDPGDGIGRARPGGDQHHPRLARRSRITLGSMCRTGFVADQDVANAVVAEQCIINGQHRAAGVAEHEFDALANQTFHQDFGATALLAHFLNLP